MKKKLLILFLFQFGLVLFASAQKCNSPMPTQIFKQHLSQVVLKPTDQAKFQYTKNLLQGSCLLSEQIRDLSMSFSGDYYRLEFCKRAWRHTFDPVNFYDVYDSFSHLSAALRLYDAVNKDEPQNHIPDPVAPPVVSGHWYPDLSYPSPVGYKGVAGCQLPIADNDFEVLSKPVVMQQNDMNRRNEAIRFVNSNCCSMGQLMKLSTLFELESNRLSFMKEVYTKVFDMENYGTAIQVFSHLPYKTEWENYCSNIIAAQYPDPEPPVVACEISQPEFTEIKNSISAVSVNSTRLTLAKQILSTKKCFSVQQIASIIGLFSIESSRLEIALYGYDYCINTGEYYQLTESLYTTSSKNKLLEFLKSKN